MSDRISDILQTMAYGPAPESAAPAHAWLDGHRRRFGLFIDGAFTEHDPARAFDSRNPTDDSVLATLTQAGPVELDAAVAAARRAQPDWAACTGHQRARVLYALARRIQRHSRLFAVLETLDTGKPIRESRDIDIPLVARHFLHHAGWAQLRDGQFRDARPIGVIGQIIPWNFPLLMLAWKVAPALAAGNTVVLKPAEWTSLTALLFAEQCVAAGVPPGVINIITGDGQVGAALVRHAGIDKIAFTGSTEVGRDIRQATAGSGRRLTLELGGKSPFIVFDDADLESAIEGVVDAIWFNQGQVCCAGSRLLLHEPIAMRFLERLRERMTTLRVGDPLEKTTDLGPVVSPLQRARIDRLVCQGRDEGATVWQLPIDAPAGGCFYPPTVLSGVAPAATVAQEEIFGPVLVTMTFRTHDEAVQLANNTRYGLAASIWSEELSRALDVARRIKAGVVWINGTNLFDAASGFGGYRESGFGREGGREGMWESLAVTYGTPAALLPPAVPPTLPGGIDRTAKLFIAGRQARPDSGYSLDVRDPAGRVVAEVAAGNRKDVRNAVEAARAAAEGWAGMTAHARAQILYYLAENLDGRAAVLAERLCAGGHDGVGEVRLAVELLFAAAAWADKYDGAVHHTTARTLTLALPEPLGVLGIVCGDVAPLAAMVALLAPALALGNAIVLVPSARWPLAAIDWYALLETSDVPAGVVNIVTGAVGPLALTLAQHGDVDGLWYVGAASAALEHASSGNLKRTWCLAPDAPLGAAFIDHALREASQWKNVWVPYGA
jgi:aldehyde dehydrogenase (NAD+)